jgi:hypothetical protein
VLKFRLLEYSLGKALSSSERFLHHTAALNAFELGAYKRRSFAWLDMQKLDDTPDNTVELDRGAGAKVVAGDHSR